MSSHYADPLGWPLLPPPPFWGHMLTFFGHRVPAAPPAYIVPCFPFGLLSKPLSSFALPEKWGQFQNEAPFYPPPPSQIDQLTPCARFQNRPPPPPPLQATPNRTTGVRASSHVVGPV